MGLNPISSSIYIFFIVTILWVNYGIKAPKILDLTVLSACVISDFFSTVPTSLYFTLPIIIFKNLIDSETFFSNRKLSLLSYPKLTLLLLFFLPFVTYDFLFGRLYLSGIGSANYVAIVYISILMSLYILSTTTSARLCIIFLMTLLLILTQSRGATLGVLYFFLQSFVIAYFPRKIRFTRNLLFLFFFTVSLGFGLLSIYFDDLGPLESRNTFTLVDESNLGRVIGFMNALNTSMSDISFLYSGLGNSSNILNSELYIGKLLPHHWLAMTIVANGWLVAMLLFIYISRLTFTVPVLIMPYFGSMLIFSVITGRSVFILSLGIFLFTWLTFSKQYKLRYK